MRKIIIVFGLFLMFVTAQAQQPQTNSNADPNMKKGVLRTGNTKNGCDTAHFVDRPGTFYEIPKVDRRGKRLKFHLDLVNKVLGCGTSDEEALLQVTIHWKSDTTDFMPKIIERGVKYWYDPNFPPPTGQSLGTVFHKIDESLNDDCSCDSVFYVMLDELTPGTHYVTRAYVVKYSPNPSSADTLESEDLFITQEREKCVGWERFENESSADGNGIELVYDHEGNDYGVAQIGNQCWLRENLRCNTSPNGYLQEAPINYQRGDTIYYKVSERDPYYYVFDGLAISYRQRGNLYNWIAVVDTFGAVPTLPQGHRRGLCPKGWHVPSNEEWYELVNYVLNLGGKTLADFHNGSNSFIGDSVVKFSFGCGWPTNASNGTHYSDANPGGYMDDAHVFLRNTTGFSAMPTNNVQETGRLGYIKEGHRLTNVANYWLGAPSEKNLTYAYSWHIDEDQHGVSSFARTRKRGFSVRCLRDALMITPYPNVTQICVNEQVTYTPTVANEPLENFTFTWMVIDRVTGEVREFQTEGNNNPSFVFDPRDVFNPLEICQRAIKYTIVCNARRNANSNQGMTAMDLWDSLFVDVDGCQSLTVCYGVDPGVINITSYNDLVDSVAWCRSDGFTASCKLPESQQTTLPPGKYAVKIFNIDNPFLCQELDSITINTVCRVHSLHSTEHEYESGYIDTVSDESGNSYPVVEINGRCWMRTNMRTRHDNQGRELSFGNLTGSGRCADAGRVAADSLFYYDVCKLNGYLPLEYRGYLYNRKTALVICPEGWHLPKLDEWNTLYSNYKGKAALLAGDCSQYWGNGHNGDYTIGNYNVENRNISGFSVVAAGNMAANGDFGYTTRDNAPSANLWAADVKNNKTSRVVFDFNHNDMTTRTNNDESARAFSVRCVRDKE